MDSLAGQHFCTRTHDLPTDPGIRLVPAKPSDEKQIGMLAQEAYKLFPELVTYDKAKDLYKMNYARFSTVAIRAIQEQQEEIEDLKKRLERLEERMGK